MKQFGKQERVRRPLLQVMPLGLMAFVLAQTARADYPSAVTNLNPVGYWRLNEPAAANITSLVTGTATNYGSVGAVGNGRYYSVTNVGVEPSAITGDTAPFLNPAGVTNAEYIEVDNLPQLLTNTSMSIECWVLRTNLSGTAAALSGGMDTGAGNDYNGFLLFLDNANSGTRNYYLRVRCSTNGNGTVISGVNYNARLFGLSGGTTLGLWDHVVYTWNKTTLSCYINGTALTGQVFPADQWYHPNASRKIRLGGDSKLAPSTLALRTWLAHAAIYPYELTYEQVTNHFAAANSAATYKATILADTPAGYWPLNESGPLAPPSTLTPVTCTNLGSWGSAANGVLAAKDVFNTGAAGVPYPGFSGATCARFPGGDGNAIIIPPQPIAASSFTISLWNKLPADAVAAHIKLFNSPTDDNNNCGLGYGQSGSPGMANNELGVQLDGFWISTMTPRVFSPSNEWAFVTMVTDPSKTVLYMNGLAATNLSVNTAAKGAHDFGLSNMFIGNGFAGSISDVAVFDYALTPEQVASLYAAAQLPAVPTTLTVTVPDVNGAFTISGATGRGRTARLWKSTDLTLGQAGWTPAGAVNGDSVTGAYSFTNNVGTDPQAFFQVK